jgi:hypothetical protein
MYSKLMKLTLPMAIVVGAIILGFTFFGVQYMKQTSIEKQQLVELKAKAEQVQLKVETAPGKTVSESAQLKIERCKSSADITAYKEAQQEYLDAANKATDSESIAIYMKGYNDPRSYKPYKEIYLLVYNSCISK